MQLRSLLGRLFSIIGLFAGVLIVYVFGLRPLKLRWGATREEFVRAMPGDGLVANPTFCATRAITIRGRPEDMWPWIVQMGNNRAGFYGYDLIENLGSERGIHSADRILSELQQPAVGDRVYMSRIAYLRFESVVPNRYLIWRGTDSPADSRVHAVEIGMWALALVESFVAVVFVFCWEPWWKAWVLAVVSMGVVLLVLYARQSVWIGVGLVLVLGAVLWIAPRVSGQRGGTQASQ